MASANLWRTQDCQRWLNCRKQVKFSATRTFTREQLAWNSLNITRLQIALLASSGIRGRGEKKSRCNKISLARDLWSFQTMGFFSRNGYKPKGSQKQKKSDVGVRSWETLCEKTSSNWRENNLWGSSVGLKMERPCMCSHCQWVKNLIGFTKFYRKGKDWSRWARRI